MPGGRAPRLGAYARRRVARILPGYWLAFVVCALLLRLRNVHLGNAPVYLALLHDYSDSTRYGGIAPTWSLSIEATFYAALPLLSVAVVVLLARARGRIRPELAEGLLVLGLLLFPALLRAVRPSTPDTILTYIDWFALGMALAVLSLAQRLPLPRRALLPWSWLLAIGAFLVCAEAAPVADGGARPHWLLGAFAFLVVAPVALAPPREERGLVSLLLNRRPLLWVGMVSYGVFLWHAPIFDELAADGFGRLGVTAVGIPLTLLLAWLSYRFVERPAQLWARRSGARPPAGERPTAQPLRAGALAAPEERAG